MAPSKAAQAVASANPPHSPANTEPLPFDEDASGDDMSPSKPVQEELDAAAALASVTTGMNDNAKDLIQDSKSQLDGSDLSSDLSDEAGQAGSGEEDEEEEDDEANRAGEGGSRLGEDEEGDEDDDEDGDDEDEDEDDEDEDGDAGSADEASELSEDEGNGAKVIQDDTTSALDALAGLAAADSKASAAAASENQSHALVQTKPRKKSLIGSMAEPMPQSDAPDVDSDDDSVMADDQQVTTGEVLSSAVSGVNPAGTTSKTRQSESSATGSKLKTSLLSNATDDTDLVGASLTADGIEPSIPPSAVTSRAGSPSQTELASSQKQADAAKEVNLGASLTAQLAKSTVPGDLLVTADGKEETLMSADVEEAGLATSALEQAEVEDEPTTDETALRRQEAMEALAKIEISFALLRDRLYVERIEETCKEGSMILDGTHPELIYLTNLIEARRRKRSQLVDHWFEQQEMQFSRVARADEQNIWSSWRASMADLRREMMDDLSRKRRRLDREKRALDAPRPPRRHHVFETELVRNPERISRRDPGGLHTEGKRSAKASSSKTGQLRRSGDAEDSIQVGDYVAFPDIRGSEEEAWIDLEAMGLRPPGAVRPQ